MCDLVEGCHSVGVGLLPAAHPLTVTATMSDIDGGVPTGTVRFTVERFPFPPVPRGPTVSLLKGTATLQTPPVSAAPGSILTISATYGGDPVFPQHQGRSSPEGGVARPARLRRSRLGLQRRGGRGRM
jgi:hypothetical protein